jgi:hypothetical protein
VGSRSNLPKVVAAKRIEGNNKYVSTPGTVNVPSAWYQLISATTGPARFLMMTVTIDEFSAGTVKIEVGVGAGGAEVSVLDVFMIGVTPQCSSILEFPLDASLIPQGSRVSTRVTNTTSSTIAPMRVNVYLGETA